MTPDRWQQIQTLFHAALDHPPAERAAFLDTVAGADPALRAEIEAMLGEDAAPNVIFDAEAEDLALLLEDVPERPAHQRRIGPYQLRHKIGQGGMGTVYLAEREDVGLRVALKLVRGGLAAPETVQRFLFERRVLARLKHPHIARLLDAGVTEDQTPYFAMEYVEGEPLTTYCDRQHLGIDERLRLFETVCEAVQYAHRNLVVHRDLKPSNIMVAGDGAVKLLDFGIAKLVEEEEGASALMQTRTGMAVMTPEYAAPEQVKGEAITTATDVYALGVVLYELLTGHRPYRVRGLTLGELEHVICETMPPKPSTIVGKTQQRMRSDGTTETITAEGIGKARSSEPERLKRRLGGDLDMIVLKALRKEPSRRYASAEALLADLRRHRVGQPVLARAQTAAYRTRKFAQRHRIGVSLSVGLLLLAGGFAVREGTLRAQAEAARDDAEKVTTFLLGLFEISDPFSPEPVRGDTLTARTLLARGVTNMQAQLVDQPVIQATMLDKIGRVYHNLAMYAEAESLLVKAFTLRSQVLGASHPDVAESRHMLARVIREQGRHEEAEQHYREALALRRTSLAGDHPDLAESLNGLGLLFLSRGKYEEAEQLIREALAIRRRHFGEEHPEVAEGLNNLGVILTNRGAYEEAEQVLRNALARGRMSLGEGHPVNATRLNNLALVLNYQGKYAEAEQIFRASLAIRRKAFDAAHPDIAESLHNLAVVLQDQGQPEHAEGFLEEALAMYQSLMGPEHPYVASTLNNLANVLQDQGKLAEAEQRHREALALRRQLLGATHPDVATSLHNLGRVLDDQGAHAEAEPLFREALAMDLEQLHADHPYVAIDRSSLGGCLASLGRYEEAESLLLVSYPILEKTYTAAHRHTRRAVERLIALYDAWGRPEEASRWRSIAAG